MNALRPIKFEVTTPADGDELRAHVAHAQSLGLPDASPPPRTLRIVANGPSARQAPLDGDTLAVNGALKLFPDGPTYWAGCDPQALLADFLTDPPERTIYLVAAHCHPSVFEALKDRDVRLWNVDDPNTRHMTPDGVPTAVSVTLCAMSLMNRMGYRRFETWGWDGCYIDGKHHASDQVHRIDDIAIIVKDQRFETTTSWAAEAEDAVMLMSTADWTVDIRGGGMIGAIWDVKRPR